MFGLYKAPRSFQDGSLFEAPKLGDTYKKVLFQHSISRINKIIENDTFEDSSSVYERFFLDCEDQIRVVARGIKKDIFDRANVINAAKIFLENRSSKLTFDLPIKDKSERNKIYASEFIRSIMDMTNNTDQVAINFYKKKNNAIFLGDLPSVSLGDDRMYRCRSYNKHGEYSTHANADVNFFDPDKVRKLGKTIDDALKKENKLD
jgi:hypothetical protein